MCPNWHVRSVMIWMHVKPVSFLFSRSADQGEQESPLDSRGTQDKQFNQKAFPMPGETGGLYFEDFTLF